MLGEQRKVTSYLAVKLDLGRTIDSGALRGIWLGVEDVFWAKDLMRSALVRRYFQGGNSML